MQVPSLNGPRLYTSQKERYAPNILFLLSDEHSYRFLSARSQEQVLKNLKHQKQTFAKAFPARVSPKTANQTLLGDGRLIDADMHLEYPNVVSEKPSADFDD